MLSLQIIKNYYRRRNLLVNGELTIKRRAERSGESTDKQEPKKEGECDEL